MKKKNTVAIFEQQNYEIELQKLEENLKTFLHLEQSFEMITGSKEIKTIDYLNLFITSLSKFPNVNASVKLLDLEIPYNYIIKNIYEVDLSKIDLVAKTVLKQALEDTKEQFTYRLTDKAETDYETLTKMAELYTKLQDKATANAICCNDFINYYVDVVRVHQISQFNEFNR
jgi:hypothetical protein